MFDAHELSILSQEIRNAIGDGIRQGFESLEASSIGPDNFRISREGYELRIHELSDQCEALQVLNEKYRNALGDAAVETSTLKRQLKQGGE